MLKQTVSALLFLMLGGGAMVGYYALQESEVERCAVLFPLTSRDLDCEEYAESRDRMTNLSAQLSEHATQLENSSGISDISIWTRDLTTRQWAAYNEHKQYTPASLLKVPIMITYYKLAEVNPSILTNQLTYSTAEANDGVVLPSQTFAEGTSYKVEELIDQMIRRSDNHAMRVLFSHLTPEVVNETLADIGIQIVDENSTFNYVTPKTFGNIFRVLYNASYIDRTLSERALKLLTETEYKGMAAPLPASIKVAHKFGERELQGPDGRTTEIQLHDCGIVYKEPHPYTLCIMTRGTDFVAQQAAIEQISKLVYDAM
jgi:beta-lactamase class A